MIHIPMWDEPVFAACKTESELAEQIRGLYTEYKRNPYVEVFVSEFQSRPVAVMGAVDKPGQFRMQRQVRLLELLSYAGGPTDKAGRVVDVTHTGGPSLCQKSNADDTEGLSVFNLADTLNRKEGANPFMQPGDIIFVPEADQVFVVGSVYKPLSIPLKDKPITVSRAIAMAGGALREAKTSKVRIVRDAGNGQKQEIILDLKAVEKQRAPDVALLPNDIVAVPSSTGKVIFASLTGAIVPVLSQTSIRAIP
jgi:polysaccharide export outer membrane protein